MSTTPERIVRVAAVQPASFMGAEEYRNAASAVAAVAGAAARGAHLVCFPEGYPGPYSGPLDCGGHLERSPLAMLQEAARAHGVYVSAGCVEPNPELCETFFITHKLIAPDGAILADYRRMQPNHPHFNAYLMGGRRHVLPGNDFVLVQTPLGRLGLLICSELFVPELARVLMLRGADIIIAPGGGVHTRTRTRLAETWRCVARARAAENLLYVVVTQNLFMPDAKGRSCIAGPEEMLAQGDGAGTLVADLPMDRLSGLRAHFYDPEMLSAPTEPEQVFGTRPGQCHDRRPDMYGDLIRSQPDAFDYSYHLRGLATWPEEYAKVRDGAAPSLWTEDD